MGLESLLLSRDPQVIRVLQPALEKLAIQVQVCQGAESGVEMLLSEKFDAVIVDCDDLEGGTRVLQDLRKSPSNRSSIAFAILNGGTTTHKAFAMGANFVLQKPVSSLIAIRCFSAGLGLMARERRRYFRHRVELPLLLAVAAGQEIRATTTNVSEGGMAIRFSGVLPKGGVVKASFTPPGMNAPVNLKAEVVWVDRSGQAGIRFLEIPKPVRQHLERWLEDELKVMDQRAAEAKRNGH
ncbi:MAG TPA: response regulator [Terriglobales bacterium]|jgi:CheY-like chemotaxis protein